MGEAVAVDRGVGGRRIGAPGHQRRREDPAAAVGERHGLDGGDRRQRSPRSRASAVVDRHPVDAGRQREAVVAQRRRAGARSPQPHAAEDEVGDRRHVVEVEDRHARGPAAAASEATASTVVVAGGDQVLRGGGAAGLDLRVAVALVALDQHQVDRVEPREEGVERAARAPPRSSVISAQRRPEATSTCAGAGGAVAVAVLAGLVDVEAVVRVLERRDGEAARR